MDKVVKYAGGAVGSQDWVTGELARLGVDERDEFRVADGDGLMLPCVEELYAGGDWRTGESVFPWPYPSTSSAG